MLLQPPHGTRFKDELTPLGFAACLAFVFYCSAIKQYAEDAGRRGDMDAE